jgi:adenylate cyclase
MGKLITELRKRNVFKIAVVYLIAAWAVMQVADIMFPALDLPAWSVKLVAALLIIGFPACLIMAWVFEVTPDGLRRERRRNFRSPRQPETDLPHDKSIAILPFVDLSEAGDQAYFSDGLTEELLNVLSRAGDLRISSRTSCFAFKGRELDVRNIAGRLNVAYVLEGSVRRSKDRIRMTAQLIRAETDSHVWSATYDRVLNDIFSVQDDIASKIARALQVTLSPHALAGATTADPEAYDFYLRGRDYYRRQGLADLAHAVTMYTRATEIDPGFTRAWIDLAFTYSRQVIYYEGGEAEQADAYQAARRAVELAPDRGDSRTALGVAHVASERYAEADEELDKAIDLDPSLWDALYWHARVAVHEGDIPRAIDYFERAAAVNPDDYESPALAASLGKGLVDEEAQERLAKQAVERVERHVEDYPDNSRAFYLGAGALLTLGQEKRARAWAQRALNVDPNDPAIRYNLGCFYARAGDPDKAFECLEGSITSSTWIENDADLDSLREDPRYRRLLEKLDER